VRDVAEVFLRNAERGIVEMWIHCIRGGGSRRGGRICCAVRWVGVDEVGVRLGEALSLASALSGVTQPRFGDEQRGSVR
jgi:hypothetical protein